MHTAHTLIPTLAFALLAGWAATMTAVEHRELKVETPMSESVFLDVENRAERSVYLDIRNTSDQRFDVAERIRAEIIGRGYRVTSDPRTAAYVLQGNIRYVGKADPSALRSTLAAGYGGPMLGGVFGALAGRDAFGAGVGALSGAALEIIAGTLVKNVTYTVVTDLQIGEWTGANVTEALDAQLKQGAATQVRETAVRTTGRRHYQTRLVATANQVNLTFDEARVPLTDALAKSIAGIFCPGRVQP